MDEDDRRPVAGAGFEVAHVDAGSKLFHAAPPIETFALRLRRCGLDASQIHSTEREKGRQNRPSWYPRLQGSSPSHIDLSAVGTRQWAAGKPSIFPTDAQAKRGQPIDIARAAALFAE